METGGTKEDFNKFYKPMKDNDCKVCHMRLPCPLCNTNLFYRNGRLLTSELAAGWVKLDEEELPYQRADEEIGQ